MNQWLGCFRVDIFRLIALCSLFLIISQFVQAQPAAFREYPSVQLNVRQSSPSITAPIDVEVVLVNLTNKTYDVESVNLVLPQSFKSIRADFDGTVSNELHEISGGDERIYVKGIPRVDMSFWQSLVDTETLFFVPGKYKLKAEVRLKESGNDKGKRSLYASSDILLEPPLNAALRGGVIGALLLALFVPAYRALNSRGKGLIKLKEAIGQFVIFFLSGTVVSITTILLIYRMGSSNLPITITVNDYLGGIIVGLFSYVFGNSLYAQFFKKYDTG